MTEKDLDIAIEKCERIMEFDTRTLKNPESENGWIFEMVYELLQYLRQFQYVTDTNVGGTDTISRSAAIEAMRKAKDKSEAHRMLIQMPSAQPGWISCSTALPKENGQYIVTVKYEHVDGYEDIYSEHGEWVDGHWDAGFGYYHCGRVEKVLAWQLLPTPYREGGTGQWF